MSSRIPRGSKPRSKGSKAPPQPVQPSVEAVGTESVKLVWEAMEEVQHVDPCASFPLTWSIQAGRMYGWRLENMNDSTVVSCGARIAVVHGLKPRTVYRFRIAAVNSGQPLDPPDLRHLLSGLHYDLTVHMRCDGALEFSCHHQDCCCGAHRSRTAAC